VDSTLIYFFQQDDVKEAAQDKGKVSDEILLDRYQNFGVTEKSKIKLSIKQKPP